MGTQYAQISDLTTLGLPSQALGSVTTDQQNAALLAASAKADSYLSSRFILPLTAWATDLTQAVCAVAAWTLVSNARGIDPESNSYEILRTSAKDALQWFQDISENRATPVVTDSRPPATATGGLAVFSEPPRGWFGDRGW